MSFWRKLNKGFNDVVSTAGGIASTVGIPVVGQVGGMVSNIIESGRNQGGGGTVVISSGGDGSPASGSSTSSSGILGMSLTTLALVVLGAYFLMKKR